MDSKASLRFARVSARKARLVANLVRGMDVAQAIETLAFTQKKSAPMIKKLVESAVANAAQDPEVNLNRLVIVDARADDGPMLQNRLRFRPGPQGRAMPFAKKTSHLTIVVAEAPSTASPAPAPADAGGQE